MKPVGQLDQYDPDVVGHGQEHLSDVLRLLFLMAVRAELRQLGDAVHELGDFGAEPVLYVGQGEVRVFGDVMQDGGGDRDRIDADVGEDLRGSQRVGDVRLAADAGLGVMGLCRQVKSLPERSQVSLRVVVGDRLADVSEARLRRRQDGQPQPQPISERQACRSVWRFRLLGPGGWYRRLNRHWNQSSSQARRGRPTWPGLQAQKGLQVDRPNQRNRAPRNGYRGEVKWVSCAGIHHGDGRR